MMSLNPILPLVFLLLTTFYHLGEGREPHTFLVGGSDQGWKIPESSDKTLNHWAESQRFRVGDSLEFDYDIKKDSVLNVTKENYEKCITEKPSEKYTEKPTIVKLDASGPHYYISGTPGNCDKGEKMIVVVQSPNHPPKPIPATIPQTPSKPPTSLAPAPANNTAVGLVAGSGIVWAFVVVIGLTWA
ncbi:hypothetical protein N665_2089s0002 [Sinapis alba]|nr:hypothetical protein N665_2089s0002 [Sinapis alba]